MRRTQPAAFRDNITRGRRPWAQAVRNAGPRVAG